MAGTMKKYIIDWHDCDGEFRGIYFERPKAYLEWYLCLGYISIGKLRRDG